MIVKNINEGGDWLEHCHEGKGSIHFLRVFESKDFESNWSFVDRSILPPGSSIGLHKHGQNEEMYFIIEGKGIMTIDGKEREVKEGDLILNKANGTHGLRNESNEVIKILVIEVNIP